MSSSQAGRVQIGSETTTGVITRGYVYDNDVIRDASDWTRQLKERRVYNSYSLAQTNPLENTEPASLEYSNSFRLQYDFGRFKCVACLANALGGDVSDFVFTGLTARDSSRGWYNVASSADGTKLVAVVQTGFIYTSVDSGATWTQRATSFAWTCVASSADGTRLVAAGENGQIYLSSDSGVTWALSPSANNIARKWRAASSSADGRYLVISVNQSGAIWYSSDYGVNWTSSVSGPGNVVSLACSTSGQYVVAGTEGTQVWRSSDYGVTWAVLSGTTNQQWTGIASSADGTKLVAAANGNYIYTSVDSGATWIARVTDTTRAWQSVASSADGTRLVAVVTGAGTGSLWTSVDSGITWAQRVSGLNFYTVASSTTGTKFVAGVFGGLIYTGGYI